MHPTSTNQTNSSSACTSKVTKTVFFDVEESMLLDFKNHVTKSMKTVIVNCYKSYI
jgi:hypothetical protein